MQVTQDYKTVTFDGNQCFAIVRALRERIQAITVKIEEAERVQEGEDMLSYLTMQKSAAVRALITFENTEFKTGARSDGAKQ
jgi:hypothetical protein